MTAFIKIIWQPEKADETKIVYSPDWQDLDNLAKADNLKDALNELEALYDEILKEGLIKPKKKEK